MIGEMFRRKREALGLTQAEVGEKLLVGQPMIAKIEAGAKMPTVVMVRMASELFDCTTDELIYGGTVPDRSA